MKKKQVQVLYFEFESAAKRKMLFKFKSFELQYSLCKRERNGEREH
jgi:hypothetical protein